MYACHAAVVRSKTTSSKTQHDQEYNESEDKEDSRSYFEKLLDWFLKASDSRKSSRDSDDRSSFQKLLEVFSRSTAYRPSVAFLPIVAVVLFIYGTISMSLGIWSMVKAAR